MASGSFDQKIGELRFLIGQYVVHEQIGQISEATTGERAAAVERIAALSILEPLNGQWSGWIAVIVGKPQCTGFVRVDAVLRKRITGLLQFQGETTGIAASSSRMIPPRL